MHMGKRSCATTPYHQQLAASDPAYAANRRRIEAWALLATPPPRAEPLMIPVVIHVLWHREEDNLPEAQLRSQIDVLNEDFRGHNADRASLPSPFLPAAGDTRVQFALARRDPGGRATSGITRTRTPVADFPWDGSPAATARLDELIKTGPHGVPAWPREHYLNLWVCPLGNGLLGYAQFPGGAAETDGVVVRSRAFGRIGDLAADYDRGRTCTHEVGHWLDLAHVWGDDGQACSGSDGIEDTPNQGGANIGKPRFPKPSCGNEPDGDMFVNFMDYVDDDAMLMFTRGQAARIAATLAGPRASLLRSPGLLDPDARPDQPPSASTAASKARSATSSA
jgi:hypothetical protein